MPEALAIVSSGKACELLQSSPQMIEQAAAEAGLQVHRINCVPHVNESDLPTIKARLTELEAEAAAESRRQMREERRKILMPAQVIPQP